jgi:glycerophosphoryl diester phosphodiesterase
MLVLGHRGAILEQAAFHQNSLKAFQEALTTADGFETDACMDSQGEIFLLHEAKYVDPAHGVEYCAAEHLDAKSAACLGSRRLDQLTTVEAEGLRLKDGSPLPTLRTAIELTGQYSHRIINIELKGYEVVEPVIHLVKECVRKGIIAEDAVVLSSFNHPALEMIRQRAPELRVGTIFVSEDMPSTPLFPWKPGSAGCYTPLTAAALETPALKRSRPDYFVIPQEILTKNTLDLIGAHYPAAKLMAWVFTEKNNLDLPDLIARLREFHPTGRVAAMLVDNPRQFRTALAHAGLATRAPTP